MNYLIVIPALNPTGGLVEYVDTLAGHGYSKILVIDDGSRDSCRYIFDEIESRGYTVLKHDVNLGKGRALKDAMRYYLDNYKDNGNFTESSDKPEGIITVDSDGQHVVEDVNKIALAMSDNPDSLILGARDFNTRNVPWKSRFGNKCTVLALKLFIGGAIGDTQTGLRGIPDSLIDHFSQLAGDRFEYETVMLIDAIQSGNDIKEVPINTVYFDDNSETHFRPVKDSLRIYSVILKTFIKYALSSLSSFIVDYAIFCTLFYILKRAATPEARAVWISTISARICSSLFNYTVNKKIVFKSRRGVETLVMYYSLCAIQTACSAALVNLIGLGGVIPVQVAKIIVDTLLFLVSFRIQKRFIFRQGRYSNDNI